MEARAPDFAGINGRCYECHIDVSNKADVFESGLRRGDPNFPSTIPKKCTNSQTMPNAYHIGLNRPLYGSRESPPRWHLAVEKSLVRFKLTPLHVDKCVSARHAKAASAYRPLSVRGSMAVALILDHVGDIIPIGDSMRPKLFKQRMGEFGHGDYGSLVPGTPSKYCGIAVEVDQHRRATLPQQEFYSKILPLNLKDFAANKSLILERAMVIRRLTSLGGCLIWAMSTRYDIMFGVIRPTSSLRDSVWGCGGTCGIHFAR